MFVTIGACMFDHMGLGQAEHTGAVRPLTKLSAHQASNALRRCVYPTVFHLVTGEHLAHDLVKLR